MAEKKKILIVEDDPPSLKLQKGLLEQAGYEIMSADNAPSGIFLAKEKLPDLIIMDNRLPGINGGQAVKILRSSERTKNIPVVFVSASATQGEKDELSVYDCKILFKPINTRTFVREIEESLNAPREKA